MTGFIYLGKLVRQEACLRNKASLNVAALNLAHSSLDSNAGLYSLATKVSVSLFSNKQPSQLILKLASYGAVYVSNHSLK